MSLGYVKIGETRVYYMKWVQKWIRHSSYSENLVTKERNHGTCAND